ncbi:MAG: hypothetical protein WAL35_09235 [Acidimicrobiales bacterium]
MGTRGHDGTMLATILARCLTVLALFPAGVLSLAACGTTTAAKSGATTTIGPQSLASAYVDMSPTRSKDLDHPYIAGKIVIVDMGGTENDFYPGNFDESVVRDIYSDGDGAIVAELSRNYLYLMHPKEVGTVIWINCRNYDAGWSYTDGLEAFNTICTATVIDKAKNLIVGENSSYTVPANRIMCPAVGGCPGNMSHGGLDGKYFARWIEHLPRN